MKKVKIKTKKKALRIVMSWQASNKACKTLWTTLFKLHQLQSNFDDSGDKKMSDLTFYNPLESAENIKQNATIIANQLDNAFHGHSAEYESNVDRTKAMASMIEILVDDSKQVKDLANIVDELYSFHGEV